MTKVINVRKVKPTVPRIKEGVRHDSSPRFFKVSKRGGFAVFDGDFDGAFRCFKQLVGTLARFA